LNHPLNPNGYVSKLLKYFFVFLDEKKKNNCKDLSVSQDLTEFTKILMFKSLIWFGLFYFIFKKNGI
jgi:hypothetical protein